jgi:protein-S-isoprenylcysteine O-methyltransferase Ste14
MGLAFPTRYAGTVQRLRVPSGFLLAAAYVWLARPAWASLAWGAPLCVAGLALRAWAAGHLEKDRALTTSGPYAWLRNPLYAGTLLAALGCAVAAGRVSLFLLIAAVFSFVYLPVIGLEEQHLRTLFPEFENYSEKVPMLVPRLPRPAPEKRFRWALYARNKEWKALGGLALVQAFLVGRLLLR